MNAELDMDLQPKNPDFDWLCFCLIKITVISMVLSRALPTV
jgi:hypothetical protein